MRISGSRCIEVEFATGYQKKGNLPVEICFAKLQVDAGLAIIILIVCFTEAAHSGILLIVLWEQDVHLHSGAGTFLVDLSGIAAHLSCFQLSCFRNFSDIAPKFAAG